MPPRKGYLRYNVMPSKLIKDKATFKRLSALGVLGNRFRMFKTVEAALASRLPMFYISGPVAAWPHMVPWCLREKLWSTVRAIEKKGSSRVGMQFVEVYRIPRMINAELARGITGVVLRWATSSKLDLRTDLTQNGAHAFGLTALQILKQRVPPDDLEMLFDLMDDWPGAIIEFSTYYRSVGIYQRPTVVWEVRHY